MGRRDTAKKPAPSPGAAARTTGGHSPSPWHRWPQRRRRSSCPGAGRSMASRPRSGAPQAAERTVEFFNAQIRNPHTRAAYAAAVTRFFAWCDARGLALAQISPIAVATYIEEMQRGYRAPTIKQHLAAIRRLFDWLVIGQVVPANPATSGRGPTHVVKTGKTPVLQPAEARLLLDTIDQPRGSRGLPPRGSTGRPHPAPVGALGEPLGRGTYPPRGRGFHPRAVLNGSSLKPGASRPWIGYPAQPPPSFNSGRDIPHWGISVVNRRLVMRPRSPATANPRRPEERTHDPTRRCPAKVWRIARCDPRSSIFPPPGTS